MAASSARRMRCSVRRPDGPISTNQEDLDSMHVPGVRLAAGEAAPSLTGRSLPRVAIAVFASVVGMALIVPLAAQARTKQVSMGVTPKLAKPFQRAFSEVNDFFPHAITIRVGDSIRFIPAGFHTVDFPPRGGRILPFFVPTGQTTPGATAPAGNPFWFNGQPQIGTNPALLRSNLGKRLTLRRSRRLDSGLPIQGRPRPMTVRFTRAGSYNYFCDVHPGMKGTVKVVGPAGRVPSARADARTVSRQAARTLRVARRLANTRT